MGIWELSYVPRSLVILYSFIQKHWLPLCETSHFEVPVLFQQQIWSALDSVAMEHCSEVSLCFQQVVLLHLGIQTSQTIVEQLQGWDHSWTGRWQPPILHKPNHQWIFNSLKIIILEHNVLFLHPRVPISNSQSDHLFDRGLPLKAQVSGWMVKGILLLLWTRCKPLAYCF